MVKIPDIPIAQRRLETSPAGVAPSIEQAQFGGRAITALGKQILASDVAIREREASTFAATENANINIGVFQGYTDLQNAAKTDTLLEDTTTLVNSFFDSAEKKAPTQEARDRLAKQRPNILERYSFRAIDFIDSEQSKIKLQDIQNINRNYADIVAEDFSQLPDMLDLLEESDYSGFTESEVSDLISKGQRDVVISGVGSVVANSPQNIGAILSDPSVEGILTQKEKETFKKAARLNFAKATQTQAIDTAISDMSNSSLAATAYADGDVDGLTRALNAGKITPKTYDTAISLIDKTKKKKVADPNVYDSLLDRYIGIRPDKDGDINVTLDKLLRFNNDVMGAFKAGDLTRSEFKTFIGIKKAEATFNKIKATESSLPFGLSTDTVIEQGIDAANNIRESLGRKNDNAFRRRVLEEFTKLVDIDKNIDFDSDLDESVIVDGTDVSVENYVNGLVEKAKDRALFRESPSIQKFKDNPPNAIISRDGKVNYITSTSKRPADVNIKSNIAQSIRKLPDGRRFKVFSDGSIEEIR